MNTLTNQPNIGSCLDFPEDFRAACLIHQLSHERVLQHFVDQVSICASFEPRKKEYARFPLEVVLHYSNLCGKPMARMGNRTDRELSSQFLRLMFEVAYDPRIRRKAKKAACDSLVSEWYAEFFPGAESPEWVQVNPEVSVTLSKDLRLICAATGIPPADILYYFARQVSLPRAKAQIRPVGEKDEGNPALAFFLAVVSGETGIYKKNEKTTHTGIMRHHLEQLQELDLRLSFNRNEAERERIYRKLYRAWYQDLLAAETTGEAETAKNAGFAAAKAQAPAKAKAKTQAKPNK